MPRSTPAAVCASLAVASWLPHTSEQYESPKADAHAATRIGALAKAEAVRRVVPAAAG